MKVEITFRDIIECESIEEAYNHMLKYMQSCVKNKDVEAFEFKKLMEGGLNGKKDNY